MCGNEGIQLRRNEKKLLNDINNDKNGRLRFHVLSDKGKPKKRIQSREEKIFVLTNDCLTGDPSVHDLSMTQVRLITMFYSTIPYFISNFISFLQFNAVGYEFYMLEWL